MGKLFNRMYDYAQREGKGVKKTDVEKKFTLTRFMKQLANKFWKLVTLNLITVAFNFPVLFVLLGLTGNFDIPFRTPSDILFQPMFAAYDNRNPVYMALYGIFGNETVSGYPSTKTYILYALGLLALLTFGCSCAGLVYMMRNFTTADAADVGGDYFRTIKKNWRQALPLGILDAAFMFIIVYDIYFFRYNSGTGFVMQAFFWLAAIIGILYFVMRFYMYVILVTFKLSLRKIIKNSFILALVGIKRNICGLLGIIAVLIINYILYIYLTPLGVLLPFVLTFALCSFIATYAAYPVIKTFMIDPYYDEPDTDIYDDEPVFTDRG